MHTFELHLANCPPQIVTQKPACSPQGSHSHNRISSASLHFLLPISDTVAVVAAVVVALLHQGGMKNHLDAPYHQVAIAAAAVLPVQTLVFCAVSPVVPSVH